MTQSKPTVSFEFFPPKSIAASFQLWETVQTLAPMAPEFVSVTYGAGVATRALTRDAVAAIAAQTPLRVAAHLTCVAASRAETMQIVEQYAALGVSDIVALRGDMPDGGAFAATSDGFADSCALVAALAKRGGFRIHVGAYSEPHPESRGQAADIDHIKAKFDAGATGAITQFFFEPDTFFRFRDACVRAGITQPIVPGILPIENWAGVRRMAVRCGAHVPPEFDAAFAAAARDDSAQGNGRTDLLATVLCTELCDALLAGGAEHLHFYTMNRAFQTRQVCHALGLTAEVDLQKVA